ncbi:MAG: FtsX-like permease family protein [Butyricicoccus sp.]
MFVKLALRNVRRQLRSYLIYFVTVALSIALMFAVNSLSYSDRIRELSEISSDMRTMFTMVTVLSSLVTALVLSYATGFMLKLRKKEFGMYLTLGMTRRNIQTLFACETGILSFLAMLAGMGAGLVIFQLVVALFASIMDMPFAISAYSVQGILLTLVVSLGLFLLSSLASLRYLKKVTVSELLKEENAERTERHPVLWCVVSSLLLAGFIGCLVVTYRNLMAAFRGDTAVELLAWLVIDLVMVFLVHVALSRTLAGMLLRNKRLKSSGTNTVVLRSLSGKMTVNALLIGALATLLVFAVCMCNVALSEKIYSKYVVSKDCPYDVMAMSDQPESFETPMAAGKEIVEQFSPITAELDYRLYSAGETTLCHQVKGHEIMEWTDKYMSLTQFNRLLSDCGYDPIRLENQYLMCTNIAEISNADFSDVTVTLNGIPCSWAGTSTIYPEFTQEWFYFVVPDEALEGMPVSDVCAAYSLENSRIDAVALVDALALFREAENGPYYRVQEYYRLYQYANAGTLMIGTLYVATVFVCMALAILSIKTLSTLDEERRRFAILYRLGADRKMQKAALRKQIGAFFLMPAVLPLLMTVPVGLIFGKIYEIWGFAGLSGQKAMETAVLIALVIASMYAMYFLITYSISCDHVICHGPEDSSKRGA